jgi:hypothetical protein
LKEFGELHGNDFLVDILNYQPGAFFKSEGRFSQHYFLRLGNQGKFADRKGFGGPTTTNSNSKNQYHQDDQSSFHCE